MLHPSFRCLWQAPAQLTSALQSRWLGHDWHSWCFTARRPVPDWLRAQWPHVGKWPRGQKPRGSVWMQEPEPDVLLASGSTPCFSCQLASLGKWLRPTLAWGLPNLRGTRAPDGWLLGKSWAQLWQPAWGQVHVPGLSNLDQTNRASQPAGDQSLEGTLSL